MSNPAWEAADASGSTERLPVAGGWLYRTILWAGEDGPPAVAMVFVPHPSPPAVRGWPAVTIEQLAAAGGPNLVK